LGYYSKKFWVNPMPPIYPSQPLSGPLKAQQGLGVGLRRNAISIHASKSSWTVQLPSRSGVNYWAH